jgi:hypothetical protein
VLWRRKVTRMVTGWRSEHKRNSGNGEVSDTESERKDGIDSGSTRARVRWLADNRRGQDYAAWVT